MDIDIQNALTVIVFCIGALAARPLMNLNLLLYRRLHLFRLVRFWERQLSWWIPSVRIVCAIGAVIFSLAGFGLINLN